MDAVMNRRFRLVIVGICTLLLTGAMLLPGNLATTRLGNSYDNTSLPVHPLGDDHGNSSRRTMAYGDDHSNSGRRTVTYGDDHGNRLKG